MPLYEFSCVKCSDRFEKLCRTTTENEVECPRCGTTAKKVFSTFRSNKSSSGSNSSAGNSCGSCSSSNCSSC